MMASPLLPLLVFLLLLQSSSSVQAQQRINLGSSLTPEGPSSSWLSPSGDFAFGFRQIDGNSSFFLLAVWFDKIGDKTVAWYAKTSNDSEAGPVQVASGSRLQLSGNGVLSLQDPTGAQVWSPKVAGAAYARMLDTGNFVLAAADGSTMWGTFDSPADTILPTQVLTPGMTLRSRIIPTDYSGGRFLVNITTDGILYCLVALPSSNHDGCSWYMKGETKRLVFDATGTVYADFDNGTQANVTYGMIDSLASSYYRATLDSDGVFRQYSYLKISSEWSSASGWTVLDFQPRDICKIMVSVGSGVCGFNSYCRFDGTISQTTCSCPPHYSFLDSNRKYKGCKPDFQTHSCDMDEESAMNEFDLISTDYADWPLADYEQYSPISESECRRLCLIDCFCAITVFHQNSSTCWKKKLPLSNGKMNNDVQRNLLLKVPKNTSSSKPSVTASSKWKNDKRSWILGSSLFLGISILINLLLIFALFLNPVHFTNTTKKYPSVEPSSNLGLPIKVFTYEELEMATDGFQMVLGSGASGIVYMGQLQDEHQTCVAVKKIDKLERETEKEFTIEVQAIGQTNHKNLVRLLGFCTEGKERLLVYEFMANGSLDRFLFGGIRLQWNLRAQLALGVARGLLYLHEECSTQIIHCDIKPQNILLDENFSAKISDFGLAKMLRTKQSHTNTGIRGTRGYVAPEWFKSAGITAKVDVYSFGVILLELICCRRNVESDVAEEDKKILTYWATDSYRCGRVDLMVEGDDEAAMDLKNVERFVEVALWCLQEDPAIRPTMRKVTQMLDGAAAIPTPPDQSSFVGSFLQHLT
ncbi:hypothetical protein PAHAL_9G411700 [Panicum hallii]|jgi:hypothetical protein|uniref:Receptor-like serine/threonine-protein kinase n=1 Tax=Panicum hallii TaxID=206008 RepID=A0A2T8I489_9POAL|nr:G-type lectin S-receptor-like serine/threonine-protein kinase LECRK4 [Panicum hallii]PVH32493.1 hypothetical protein PAHAL_9G411700 [Panicum hallii]